MRIEPPANRDQLTEAQFQREVIDAAAWNGWKAIHINRAIGNPILPDLLLFKENRALLIELKRERGTISQAQFKMIDDFHQAGIMIWTIRPSDWELLLDLLEEKNVWVNTQRPSSLSDTTQQGGSI